MNKNVDSAKKVDVSKILGKYGVYIALLVLFVVMSFASSSFLTVTNLFKKTASSASAASVSRLSRRCLRTRAEYRLSCFSVTPIPSP